MAFLICGCILISAALLHNRYRQWTFRCAARDDVSCINRYLNSGGDPNATYFKYDSKVSGPRSLLSWAASGGAVNVASILLDSGADLSPPLRIGHPVMEALHRDDGPMMSLFMQRGFNPWEPTLHSSSLVLEAMHIEKWCVIEAMVPHLGQSVDWVELISWSHWESPSHARTRAVRQMILHGMSTTVQNRKGKSLLSIAMEQEDEELIAVLMSEEFRGAEERQRPE